MTVPAGGQRGLHKPLAARKGQARANDAGHDKPAVNVFQFLGDILTDPAQGRYLRSYSHLKIRFAFTV